ncbi:MAG: transglycosylase SLT domain-containing protein [Desulfomonile tiedjei]|uniref:Transglycosylase SLT domain-containing protein n=1 Tax=Desulfomonile tiedjei TaxID=2358 RepID=A0A9D6V736_9BACT|nr:transglycosylase SLT domain-containing protein [Desulfomonile tiedjei]
MRPGISAEIGNACGLRAKTLANVLILTTGILFLGGCGSNRSIVKSNFIDYKPAVANATNAISRAIALGSHFNRTPPAKQNAYPEIPSDYTAPRVRQFVREYAYTQRESMKRYLARAEAHLPMVRGIANEHGLPEDLAYLLLLESGGNPEARSPANALGMWQFMPATARSYGLRVDSWVDERLDPTKSTKAAMLYLKDLYGMFGCWRLALSAYNSGENKLNRVLCQEDANEYDEICSSRHLKRETREFFPRFQAIAQIAKTPEKYGFPLLREKPPHEQHELAPMSGSYSLETLAKATSISRDKLLEMNPALVRGMTPPGMEYSLRVPAGKKEALLAELGRIPEENTQRQIIHVVNKGESLSKILNRYKVDKRRLAGLNPDVNLRKRLRPGDKIVIPVEKVETKKTVRKPKRLSSLN